MAFQTLRFKCSVSSGIETGDDGAFVDIDGGADDEDDDDGSRADIDNHECLCVCAVMSLLVHGYTKVGSA